jgi:hypothetical protein
VSHLTILRDASVALRSNIFGALTDVPDVDFGFTTLATDIVLSAPDSDIPAAARLSIYLYHIEPDPQLRNQPELSDGTTGLLRPPLALRLYYLMTPLLDDDEVNQLVLGRILQALHDRPFINEVAGGPLDNSNGGGSTALRLSLEPMTLDNLSRVWHAMGSDYRLSVAYLMRTVMIDSAMAPRRASRVEEAHIAVEQRGVRR